MDPDENLRLQRGIAQTILLLPDDVQGQMKRAELADELAALVTSMDGWLRSGGYQPEAWIVPVHHSRFGTTVIHPIPGE
jgi:hypothetical protein